MASARPQDLILTLFGDYLLHRPGPVWVGSLIHLLGRLGLKEGSVRTTLSRAAQRGWLVSERVGRFGYYDLAEKGRKLLEEGEYRIYHADWDRAWRDEWFLVAYSIPENQRTVRDRLRTRLEWLGFGSLGNGLWISPHDVRDEVAAVSRELDLGGQLLGFRAEGPKVGDRDDLVRACWDLPGLNAAYEAFIGAWTPLFLESREAVDRGELEPERAFELRFQLIHEYRQFPLRDPYLPRELLPANWGGECAAHLFRAFHDLLAEPGDLYVDQVLSMSPAVDRAPMGG